LQIAVSISKLNKKGLTADYFKNLKNGSTLAP
jgi:hypothetical protein